MADVPLRLEDLVRELEQDHREAMLDLVLAWGSLDGAISALLAHVLGVDPVDGAALLKGVPTWEKFEAMRDAVKSVPGGDEAAKVIRKHKKSYERHAATRDIIAHSHCAGYWAVDPEYVIFAKFERVGDDGLAVDRVPPQEMQRATRWGRAMTDLAWKIIDAGGGYADDEDGS